MQFPVSAWQIISPFWLSKQKKIAWGLLSLSIFLDMTNVYILVKFTYWQKNFFDALAEYNLSAIKPLMISFFVMACVGLFTGVFSIYFKQLLEIKWRSWMTTNYLHDWLKQQRFYQIQYQQLTDNPDQRIAEDLALLAEKSIALFTGFLKNAINLVSYSIVIWGLCRDWRFNLWGTELAIPGIMLWLAIIYAVLGSWAIEKIGHPLVNINYIQQRNEANFRYLLVRIRENAEQIALSKGESNEKTRLFTSFAAIKENWRKIMLYTKRITFTEELYVEVGAYLPYLLMLPQYFAKRMSIGDVMQTTIAFGRLRMALSWFVFQYKELAELRAILNRLTEFQSALQLQQQASIHIQTHPSNQLQLLGLELKQPDGKVLAKLQDVCFSSGDHWLIQGASGSGKTTLFRAIAGLWPHGHGQILIPEHKQIMYMPQKSYLPIGPLKDALCYPRESSNFSDQVCRDLLQQVRLQHLSDQLKQSNDWEKLLSPGEQQRLAFARVLLQKPDYVFLDEVTSALDLDNEQHLYQLLLEQLPNTTIISIAHHPSLRQFHQHHLDIRS